MSNDLHVVGNEPHVGRAIETSNSRPRSVTFVGWLFVAAGCFGFAYHATELQAERLPASEEIWVLLLRLLAIVAGGFILRRANWARWVAIAWMAYHVVLGAFHSFAETATHAALLVAIAYVLFRPTSAAYFASHA